ncbi:MAG: hypothetical protein ABI855_12730 [Bacteroidota bacterium]
MIAQMQGVTINSLFSGLATSGTQTSTSAIRGPYLKGSNTNGRVQYLYTAVELLAAGLSPGNITALEFNIPSLGAGTMFGWTISMATTASASLTATFKTGPFTTVMSPLWGGIDPVIGWNTHNFTTLFNWNGLSNIVIQICYNASGTQSTAVTMESVAGKCTYYNGSNACINLTGITVNTRAVMRFGYFVNNTSWGAVTAYNNAVNFEFGEVKGIPGSGTAKQLKDALKYSYTTHQAKCR